jgi:hypothetical protein
MERWVLTPSFSKDGKMDLVVYLIKEKYYY